MATEYKSRALPLGSPAGYRTTFIIRIANTMDGGMAGCILEFLTWYESICPVVRLQKSLYHPCTSLVVCPWLSLIQECHKDGRKALMFGVALLPKVTAFTVTAYKICTFLISIFLYFIPADVSGWANDRMSRGTMLYIFAVLWVAQRHQPPCTDSEWMVTRTLHRKLNWKKTI